MSEQAAIRNEGPVSAALVDKREVRIRRMFGSIAPSYDLLNHLLCLNTAHYWRWRTARLVPPNGDAPILDLCTGTGDLALAFDRAASGRVPIVGADFCHEMLVLAGQKTARRQAADRIRYLEADAQRLPFPDSHFQITTADFGLRNHTYQHLRTHVGRTWPAQHHQHGLGTSRDGARHPVRWSGRHFGVLPATYVAVQPDLPFLLPAHLAAGRPSDFAQQGRRLSLPTGQRVG